MKISLALPVLVLAIAPCAFAQQRGGNFNGGRNGNNNNGRNNNQGTLPLPPGVDKVVSIDAYNILLAQSHDDNGNQIYTPITVKHVYSGGMAALFGGTSIPTEQFVSPGFNISNGGGVGGQGGQGGFGGLNGGGIGGRNNGIGGVGGFNGGGFNGGGFNGGGFNGGGFNGGGFNGGGFNGGGFNGGGFNGGGFNGGGIGGPFTNGNFSMNASAKVGGTTIPLGNINKQLTPQ